MKHTNEVQFFCKLTRNLRILQRSIKLFIRHFVYLLFLRYLTFITTSKINDVMAKLNAFIYGENIVAPVLIVTKPNSYTFGTDMDDGTGTNYKNLILLDLASLKLTELPTIAHDTIVFHNIGQEPMAKILELYNKSEKQIFIAIDESAKYNEIAQKIIENNKILELSGNGNELFGSSWITKTSDSDLQE